MSIVSPPPLSPPQSSANPPRRYLALWFPFLSTDRVRHQNPQAFSAGLDKRPFALVEKAGGALRLAALNAAALQAGLTLGTGLADARSIVPDLVTGEIDRQADAASLLAAAAACERFTPLVALDGEAGLVLDITGCAHLFGEEEDLRRAAGRCLAGFGLTARATIAGTPEAARAFARFSRYGILPPGSEAEHARALPVTALDAGTGTTIALTRVGLKTLGDLSDRPSGELVARFGAPLSDALRRIFGREDIRITPLRAPPKFIAEKHFPEPLSVMESLLIVLERLAGDLSELMEQRGQGGRCFEASFFRSDGAVRRLTVETAQGTRDVASLMRLIRLRIEALADPIDPGFGFDAIRLSVTRSEALEPEQQGLAGGKTPREAENAVVALVDRLVARLGRESVRRFLLRDTHDPVRAAGTLSCLAPAETAFLATPVEPGEPPLRPLTLFEPPQLIEALAEVPDGPPLRFRWRRVLHDVARAEGPERIAPEWWLHGARAPATRDYYRVEDGAGHRFWVFREGFFEDSTARPRWFLHGLFA